MFKNITIGVLLTLAVGVIGAYGAPTIISWVKEDEISRYVRQQGYRPILPPSQASPLGQIFLVDTFGRANPICNSSSNAKLDEGSKSVVLEIRDVSDSVIGGKIKLDDLAKVTSQGSGQHKVVFGLWDSYTNSRVLTELAPEYTNLKSNNNCRKEIDRQRAQGFCIAQSRETFQATTDLRIKSNRQLTANAAISGSVLQKLRNMLPDVDARIGSNRQQLMLGQKLFYGYKLTLTCRVSEGDSPRFVPDDRRWYLTPIQDAMTIIVESIRNRFSKAVKTAPQNKP